MGLTISHTARMTAPEPLVFDPVTGVLTGATQAELDQMRHMQRPLSLTAIGVTSGASLGDMADRIGALIAIAGRIRRAADAD